MMQTLAMTFGELMTKGGYVMWPLLVLSVVAVTLLLERAWYFLRTNGSASLGRTQRVTRLLREGDRAAAANLASGDSTVYSQVARELLDGGGPVSEARAVDAIESHRRELERFMPTLSTIITAAPMLGILGTVLGIIASFEAISQQAQAVGSAGADPRAVGAGIAEALLTTAAGLVVAVVTLFPYNALRAQVDRTLSRLEALVAAAVEGSAASGNDGPAKPR